MISDFRFQIQEVVSPVKVMSPVDSDELRRRTKDFAFRVLRLVTALPRDRQGDVAGRQIAQIRTEKLASRIDECGQQIALLAAGVKTAKYQEANKY